MTNAELLTKLKAEIEKQKESMRGLEPHTDFRKGQIAAYNQMLGIISSVEDVDETLKINEKMKQHEQSFASKSAMSQEAVRNFRFLDTLESEKPRQEELEKEIERWVHNNADDNGFYNQIDFARHFAQWGAEHLANSNDEVVINGHKVAYDKDKDAITMEAIPNELEEAAENYSKERAEGHILYDWVHAFKARAKWDREQMMKEAVEGEIEDVGVNYIDLIDFDAEKLGLVEGDKVRVIVLPKED